MAKYYASEASVRAANAAVQVHGGYGYVDEYPVGKYLRDARVTTLYEGTSQVQKLIIGRALTGEIRLCLKQSSFPPRARRSGAPARGRSSTPAPTTSPPSRSTRR